MNNPKDYNPPQEIKQGKLTYTFLETKTTNSKGQILSEKCYWYLLNGKREPMSKGNIIALRTIA
jgi:hypothetical protein